MQLLSFAFFAELQVKIRGGRKEGLAGRGGEAKTNTEKYADTTVAAPDTTTYPQYSDRV